MRFVALPHIIALVVFAVVCTSGTSILTAQTGFVPRTVATDLSIPWEIEFGTDGMLWTSERIGILSRIDIETGAKQVVLDMRDSVYVENEVGLLGFTWHPDFPDSPFVYVAYVAGSSTHNWKGVDRFSFVGGKLVNPKQLFRLEPAENFHQGCRLIISPDRKLFVTMGDAPYSVDMNPDSVPLAKLLRFNLDGSIPSDNPVPGNPLYSRGHRNVQGITFHTNGGLYTSEHGNAIEDEVNLVEKDRHYGWPFIEGKCDNEFERKICDSLNVVEPIWTSGVNSTVAPCGMAFYAANRYPSLKNSILLTTLKYSAIVQLVLNEDGTQLVETHEHLAKMLGRLRDVAIHPDGRVFVCTSNREPNGYHPFPQIHDDRIVELVPFEDCDSYGIQWPDTVFARSVIDTTAWFDIPVTNTGTCMATIEFGVNTVPSTDIKLFQWRYPIQIPPGGTALLAGQYVPSKQADTAVALLRSVNSDSHSVVLVGRATSGFLSVSEKTLTFEPIIGQTTKKFLTLTNVGNDRLHIEGARVMGHDQLHFDATVPDTMLLPNESIVVPVEFTPPSVANYGALLYVESNSPNSTVVNLVSSTRPVSVNDDTNTQQLLRVVPNPASNEVVVNISERLGTADVTIYNSVGEIVWQGVHSGDHPFIWIPHGTDVAITSGTYSVCFRDSHQVHCASFVLIQ